VSLTGKEQAVRIVVLSPHRDDAAFSLTLAIEAWLKAGFRVEVLNCFTRSEYAPYSDADSIHPHDRRSYVTALREREDKAWLRQLGTGVTITDLNLKDAPLRLRCSADEVCNMKVDATEKAFLKIEAWFRHDQADAVVLPLALGAHVDHLTARDAALAGLNVAIPRAFYEDLPYAARPGAAEQIEAVALTLGRTLTCGFVENSKTTNEAVVRKRKAALCYDSQVDDDVIDSIAHFSSRYEGKERLWMNEMWRTSRRMNKSKADFMEAS
jgi:LmbE family N-acetylglucosaminyl deacetylase